MNGVLTLVGDKRFLEWRSQLSLALPAHRVCFPWFSSPNKPTIWSEFLTGIIQIVCTGVLIKRQFMCFGVRRIQEYSCKHFVLESAKRRYSWGEAHRLLMPLLIPRLQTQQKAELGFLACDGTCGRMAA